MPQHSTHVTLIADDSWLMHAFEVSGYSSLDLQILNKVQQHQQAIFESNVFVQAAKT